MCRQFISNNNTEEEMMASADYHCTTLPDPLTRSYRRVMKPRLPRKVTASARINLNRFWNELEEFYNRYDQRKEKPVVRLPDYTTDSWDHDREAAENQLNESLQQDNNIKDDSTTTESMVIVGETKVLMAGNSKPRLGSDDVDIALSSGSNSSDEDTDDEVFLWNVHERSRPAPPRTLLDLIQRLSM